MINASRLARIAYSAMADSVHRMQLEIVQQEAINKRFGDDALPVNKISRMSANRALSDRYAHEQPSKELVKHMSELLEAMREFESMFEIEEKEDMAAFARSFKNRFK